MMKPAGIFTASMLLVASCTEMQTGSGASGYMKVVPEGVLEIAAPNQDLTAVKIDPIDGCYVYRHIGPVETTLLPLRAKNGRPICTRPRDPEPTAEAEG